MKHRILVITLMLAAAATGIASAKEPAAGLDTRQSTSASVKHVRAAGAVFQDFDPESLVALGGGLVYLTVLWRKRNKF